MKQRKKSILPPIIALILVIAAIKWVPPVNSIAREYIPGVLLNLIGEEPKGVFEKGLDDLKSLVN